MPDTQEKEDVAKTDAKITNRTVVEPTYEEGVLDRHTIRLPGIDFAFQTSDISPKSETITGMILRNPDGSKITVRFDAQYQGQSYFAKLLDLKQFVTRPLGFNIEPLNKAMFDNTQEIRNGMLKAYQDFAATEKGSEFFTRNAKTLQEVTWVTPKISFSHEGWKNAQLNGNVQYANRHDKEFLIISEHQGAADAIETHKKYESKLRQQEGYHSISIHNPISSVLQEAHTGRTATSSTLLNEQILANINLHHQNQRVNQLILSAGLDAQQMRL